MPSVTLISFIGAHGIDYAEVGYRFSASGSRRTTRYFGHALLEELRSAGDAPPDRWIIVGTPTSGWDQLRFCVASTAPQHAQVEDVATAVYLDLDSRKPVSPHHLDLLGTLISEALDLKVHLLSTTDEGDDIFAVLHRELPKNGDVEADITHGFRTMPLNMMIALGALRWISGIRVRGIHYGKMLPSDPHAPRQGEAHRLHLMSLMAQATPALASLSLRGDVREIADVVQLEPAVEKASDALRDTQRLEDLMQYDASAHRIAQAKGLLRRALREPVDSMPAFMRACSAVTLEVLEELGDGTSSAGLVERSQAALKRSDFLRATSLAHEALLLRAVDVGRLRQQLEADGGAAHEPYYDRLNDLARQALADWCAKPGAPSVVMDGNRCPALHALRTLRRCRNAALHAGTGLNQQAQHQAPRALVDEIQLKALIEWSHEMHEFITPV